MFDVFAAFFLFGTAAMVTFVAFLGFLEWRASRAPETVAPPAEVPAPAPAVTATAGPA